jgi:hypothetical protein
MTKTVAAPSAKQSAVSIRLAAATCLALLLTGCGESAVCSKPDVLDTVKRLFEERELGQFKLPGLVTVMGKTATFLSTDKQSNASHCSVIVTVDLMQILRATQNYSDEQLSKAKQAAEQKGQPTTSDNLVNYKVQTLNGGQHYITVLP